MENFRKSDLDNESFTPYRHLNRLEPSELGVWGLGVGGGGGGGGQTWIVLSWMGVCWPRFLNNAGVGYFFFLFICTHSKRMETEVLLIYVTLLSSDPQPPKKGGGGVILTIIENYRLILVFLIFNWIITHIFKILSPNCMQLVGFTPNGF